jgi:hypothetical protein
VTGVAAAEGEHPNQAGTDAGGGSPLSGDGGRPVDTGPRPSEAGPRASGAGPRPESGPRPADTGPGASGTGSRPGGAGLRRDEPVSETPDATPQPFSLVDLLLLGSVDNEAVAIDVVTFSSDGVGVIRKRGERPRVLPWSSVITHVVEPWSGGVIPEWWVDPELNRRGPAAGQVDAVTDPTATNRARPGLEPGALIGIQTPTQTYRFLLPGGDAREISRQVAAFAARFQGPTGASSVTRVVRWGQDLERRRVARTPERDISWARVQPFLVVALILFLAAAVTIILLQSAGTIHLPYLGGVGSGVIGLLRTP